MLQTESQVALNTVESVEGFLTDVQSGNWCGAETHARTHARARADARTRTVGVVTGLFWQGRGADSMPVAAAALE